MTQAADTPDSTPKPTRLAPIVTLDAKFFWEGADREQFLGERCGQCKAFRFPPRPMCPHCHSLAREEVPLSGRGTVAGWTVPRHPMPFGFKEAPAVAIIELEQGFRFVSNVVGVPHEQLRPGLPVEVCFEPTMNKH